MSAILRVTAFAIAAALPSASMTACFDIEHTTVLYPDGSGKFVLSITVVKENYKDKKWDSADEALAGCLNCCEGFTAWGSPSLREDEKRLTYTIPVFFEDIGKFRWSEAEGKRETLWSFELTKTAKGHELVFRDKILKDWIEATATPLRPEEKEGADDRYDFTLTVPGKITGTKGVPLLRGRTAEVRLDDKLKFEARRGDAAAKKLVAGLSPEISLTWSASEVSKDDLEAFKKELAAAKETWKAMEPRIRKIAEEKKRTKD